MTKGQKNKLIDVVSGKSFILRHAIKTSIAAILTVIIYQFFNLPKGYWAVITCIVIMQSNIDSGSFELTIKLAIQRLIGTASGACLGLILTYFIGSSYIWLLFLIAVLIMLGSYLTLFYKGFNLFSPTAIIIILLSHQGPITESIAFYRTIEIILGVVIAVVVTILIWPYRLGDYLENNIRIRIKSIRKQFEYIIEMLTTGGFNYEWVDQNKLLLTKISADRQYLLHLNRLKGEFKDRALLVSMAEKKLMDELDNVASSIPNLPNSFRKSKLLEKSMSDNIQVMIKCLENFIKNDWCEQVNLILSELKLYRDELSENFNKFRHERKNLSKEIYSLDESYAVFSFIQAILSSSKVCEELIQSVSGGKCE